jgi:formylmethanofuran dehydrogenase subunit E
MPDATTALKGFSMQTDTTPDWFFPDWAAKAPGSAPILVRDTDSALGRYSLQPKAIGLKDLARVHGHLCDGLVISFVLIKAGLEALFADGIIDRTDLRAVSKNGPCWVDTVALMTGARINFQTLRIDNSVGDGFILQRMSNGLACDVRLKPGVFPVDQAALEADIRATRARGEPVGAALIDQVEAMANALSERLLTTPPAQTVSVAALATYRFAASDLFGTRGDIINKDMPRGA